MTSSILTVDEFHIEKQFRSFKRLIETKSRLPLKSFSQNPYTWDQEGYKYEVYRKARRALDLECWKRGYIGSGRIARAVISAIELTENNLVLWQARFGNEKRPHNKLYIALEQLSLLEDYERILYDLYYGNDDGHCFSKLVELFGRKYALLAYLFFLKDHAKYMPIAPRYFDIAFEKLGVSFKTSYQCSWENYTQYNNLLHQIKLYLSSRLEEDTSLIDAHSFAWMIASMKDDPEMENQLKEYDHLSSKDRESVIKARIGQGRFRRQLLFYWGRCAVTICREPNLLFASHIKPWSECAVREAINPFNGLLLSPNLDAAFDRGFISFSESGKIIISKILRVSDAEVLGIDATMKLRKVDKRHRPYLRYHRKNIYREC